MRWPLTRCTEPSLCFQGGISLLAAFTVTSWFRSFQHRRAISSHQTSRVMTSVTSSMSADALAAYAIEGRGEWSLGPVEALRRIVPDLGQDRHKGQLESGANLMCLPAISLPGLMNLVGYGSPKLGRVGIFGGSRDYTGAPFFASMSALRTGADLAYVMTAEEAAPALKAYNPELMVTPVYSAAWPGGFASSASDFHKAVSGLLPKLHSLVMGPGMGREQRLQVALTEVLRSAIGRDLPLVLDADALVLVACDGHARLTHEDLQGRSVSELDSLLRCYRRLVLTPNAYEFKLLDQRIKSSGAATAAEPGPEDANGELAVEHAAKSLGGVTVVRKGKVDVISDGSRTISCGVPGGLKRCGGIGDVLSGAMGTFMAWVSIQGFVEPEAAEMRMWAAWWACAVTKHASRLAYEAHGRSMSATHVLEHVGRVLEDIAPSPPVL